MFLEGFRHVWLHVLLLLIYGSLQNKQQLKAYFSLTQWQCSTDQTSSSCSLRSLYSWIALLHSDWLQCWNNHVQEPEIPGVGFGRTDQYQVCPLLFFLLFVTLCHATNVTVKSEKVDYWFLLSDDSCNFCLLFHLCVWPHVTSSFCSTGPTGGAITQTQMRSYMSSTAATATGWASQSPSWWPCWRWRRVERVKLSHRNSWQNGLSFILHAFRIMCTPGRRAEESHLGGICK